jgi:hypothetical protein
VCLNRFTNLFFTFMHGIAQTHWPVHPGSRAAASGRASGWSSRLTGMPAKPNSATIFFSSAGWSAETGRNTQRSTAPVGLVCATHAPGTPLGPVSMPSKPFVVFLFYLTMLTRYPLKRLRRLYALQVDAAPAECLSLYHVSHHALP